MVSVLADYHFAPTSGNRKNLIAEGKAPENIIVTGNTVIDALLRTVDDNFNSELLSSRDYNRVILITAHRRENFGKPLENICKAVRQMAVLHSNWIFIYPVHLNKNVQEPVRRILSDLNNVQLLDPMDYYTFANYMAGSDLILTDSGGIQEEAPSLAKPVLVNTRPMTIDPIMNQTDGSIKSVNATREFLIKNSDWTTAMVILVTPMGITSNIHHVAARKNNPSAAFPS